MVDASEDFHEVSEIMSRHATLLATNKDLRQQQQRVTDLAEETRCGDSIAFSKGQNREALYVPFMPCSRSASKALPSYCNIGRCRAQKL